MKMVLNRCYGGFTISDACAEKIGLDKYDTSDAARTNPAVIKEVERDYKFASGFCSCLRTVTIPDEVTDYEVDEYDGYESITYVLDGKLYHA